LAYGILASLFLAGARTSFGRITTASFLRNASLNETELLTGKGAAQISFTNYDQLMRVLKIVGPDLQKQFKKDSVKLAASVRNPLKQTLRSIGPEGPLPGAKRSGRNYDRWVSGIGKKSWGGTGGNRRPYDEVRTDFKDRSSSREAAKLRNSQSGRLGIVRLRVTSGPTIIADLAGASRKYMYGRGTFWSTEYKIRLFGRVEVVRRHRINKENSDNFVRRLTTASKGKLRGKPSRYAYPTVQKNKGKFEKQMNSLIGTTVKELNARINK
jgi:hypothetical protein